tara:strand:- start:299 stop:520 length:222 start_codon:yes stop_codon:yes gene_type:complete
MKITKARLKEIINEELERVMDDSRNLANIAEREQEIIADLSILEKKKQIHGPTEEIVAMIEKLELELQQMEPS